VTCPVLYPAARVARRLGAATPRTRNAATVTFIVDFLYWGITHEYGNFYAAPPSGCLGVVALVAVVILATICAVMVVVQP
jgi:hypothetical protein